MEVLLLDVAVEETESFPAIQLFESNTADNEVSAAFLLLHSWNGLLNI